MWLLLALPPPRRRLMPLHLKPSVFSAAAAGEDL